MVADERLRRSQPCSYSPVSPGLAPHPISILVCLAVLCNHACSIPSRACSECRNADYARATRCSAPCRACTSFGAAGIVNAGRSTTHSIMLCIARSASSELRIQGLRVATMIPPPVLLSDVVILKAWRDDCAVLSHQFLLAPGT